MTLVGVEVKIGHSLDWLCPIFYFFRYFKMDLNEFIEYYEIAKKDK